MSITLCGVIFAFLNSFLNHHGLLLFKINPIFWCILLILSIRSLNQLFSVIHEIGHYIAAKVLGFNPYKIEFGRDAVLLDVNIKGVRLILKSLPDCGLIWIEQSARSFMKFRLILVDLSGVFFEILVLLALILCLYYSLNILVVVAPGMMFVLLDASRSLIPRKIFFQGEFIPNDGMNAINLIFKSKSQVKEIIHTTQVAYDFEQVEYAFKLAHHKLKGIKSEEDDISPLKFWELVVQEIDENIVLGCYQNSLDNAELSIDERNYFLDVFVTLSVMYESSDFLEEAERYSRELLNNLPHDLSAKGSRGCVLVEMGDIAGGIELLTEVMQKEEEPVIRLICAA